MFGSLDVIFRVKLAFKSFKISVGINLNQSRTKRIGLRFLGAVNRGIPMSRSNVFVGVDPKLNLLSNEANIIANKQFAD